MTIYDRIRIRRAELDMSQQELAVKVGYKTKSAINKIEAGIRDINQSQVIKFAEALQTTPAYLMGWEEDKKQEELNIFKYNSIKPVHSKKIKSLEKIASGKPIFADENSSSYIELPDNIKADFCLIARDESMTGAKICAGDIVFIHEQTMVENGEIAAVIINDEAVLKRWYYYPQEHKLILVSENPKYEPLVYINEELNGICCIGKAAYFMSPL